MKLVKGQVVQSRAGRDAGKAYAVVGLEEDRVLLADGHLRPLANPKAKNLRHVNPSQTVLPPADMAGDTELKKALAVYTTANTAQTQK